MNSIFNKFFFGLKCEKVVKNTFRNLFNSSRILSKGAYEGDGKTKVQILNKEIDGGLMINSYSQFGFRLNNGMVIMGPLAIFPEAVLSWNVNDHNDIHEDSLSLFSILEPKLDVLVIGIGDERVTPEISNKILRFMRKFNINVEILQTDKACATFNFLNTERRWVAGALIPPKFISVNEDDVLKTKRRRRELYDEDDEKLNF